MQMQDAKGGGETVALDKMEWKNDSGTHNNTIVTYQRPESEIQRYHVHRPKYNLFSLHKVRIPLPNTKVWRTYANLNALLVSFDA